MNKKFIALIILAAILLVSWFTYNYYGYTPKSVIENITEPEFKEVTEYSPGGAGYACSKPIKVQRQRKLVGHMGGSTWETHYLPVNPDEANLFCHGTWIEEYEGKITVLQKPEVLDLISKYEPKDVSIKALEFALIKSEGFVDRLLPQYKNREIGCIIILETPNEKMVFLEDENLETFEQMGYKLFDQQLDQVSPADKQLFLENLQ
ncbi:MAG: hypothetical protein WD231_00610 [Candidatus Woykebacteria bacterium]